MRVGIIGLPLSGKTTLFNALTGAHGDTTFHGGGDHVEHGVVTVPDERLDALAEMLTPREVLAATIEFEDIGGVFAHLDGDDHGGRATAEAREVDALLMVLRAFESDYAPRALDGAGPERQYGAMTEELLLADLEVIEKRLHGLESDIRKATPERDTFIREQQVLARCRAAVEEGKGLRDLALPGADEKLLRSYSLLTLKPHLCVLNIGEGQIAEPPAVEGLQPVPICAELEMELMDLDADERGAFLEDAGLAEMASGRVIRACYGAAGLCTFFTHVSDKLRAWTVPVGTPARQAAGRIHTDMEKGFIRAEGVSCADLLVAGSLKDAKSVGRLRMEGKDHEIQDGDVVTFHFSR